MTKKVLFENVGGNKFKLISENVNSTSKTDLVREGLRKVFESANGKPLTYKSLANIGMGYIKDVAEARKCALQEAKYIAEAFGYVENVEQKSFVKETETVPSVAATPTPQSPSQIGQQIINTIEEYLRFDLHPYHEEGVEKIKELAQQLIQLK